jgi:hypothetical protein
MSAPKIAEEIAALDEKAKAHGVYDLVHTFAPTGFYAVPGKTGGAPVRFHTATGRPIKIDVPVAIGSNPKANQFDKVEIGVRLVPEALALLTDLDRIATFIANVHGFEDRVLSSRVRTTPDGTSWWNPSVKSGSADQAPAGGAAWNSAEKGQLGVIRLSFLGVWRLSTAKAEMYGAMLQVDAWMPGDELYRAAHESLALKYPETQDPPSLKRARC